MAAFKAHVKTVDMSEEMEADGCGRWPEPEAVPLAPISTKPPHGIAAQRLATVSRPALRIARSRILARRRGEGGYLRDDA